MDELLCSLKLILLMAKFCEAQPGTNKQRLGNKSGMTRKGNIIGETRQQAEVSTAFLHAADVISNTHVRRPGRGFRRGNGISADRFIQQLFRNSIKLKDRDSGTTSGEAAAPGSGTSEQPRNNVVLEAPEPDLRAPPNSRRDVALLTRATRRNCSIQLRGSKTKHFNFTI